MQMVGHLVAPIAMSLICRVTADLIHIRLNFGRTFTVLLAVPSLTPSRRRRA
jgi:hypothetical protein